MQPYELIVVGSGPGGQRAAINAVKAGKRVALVEKQSMGGVCINTGTIPSKTMREAVLHLSGFYDQSFYGANYHSKDQITMADLNFRVQRVIENEISVIQDQLKRNGVDIYHGMAKFMDPHHIRVENNNGFAELEGEYVILATGTKPAANPKVPINGRNIINSDQILSMPQVPRTLIVVGGGVIGVEYACMFATLGVRVIIVEKRPRLLEFADTEMVEALSYHMRDRRATMRLSEEVESVEELPDGKVAANLASKKRIIADALLYAVGRAGNVEPLDLPAAGLTADDRGRIKVDQDFRTSVPHIFAVGDVIGFPSLCQWSRDASPRRAHSVSMCTATPPAIPMGFTRSHRFLSLVKRKSNSPTKTSRMKSASLTIAKSHADKSPVTSMAA
jgi:NAD(P) transhydrogenase